MTNRLSPAEDKLLREYVARLLAAAPAGAVRAVTVFGSRARGTSDERSDLDLAVEIAPNADASDLRQLASNIADKVMAAMDAYGLGLSVIVLPPGPSVGLRSAIERDGIRIWTDRALA